MLARTLFGSATVLALTLPAAPSRAKGPYPLTRAAMARQWHHAPPLSTRPLTPEGRPALVLEMINTGERIELAPSSDDGGFSAEDLARVSAALHDPKNGESHPVDARLLDLVYQLEVHFDAPLVRIVSAFRGPVGRNGNHGRGRAIDLVVPGVRDADVATFARRLGFVGVGIYPDSGFVHLDVRSRSYFWVEASRPGRRPRLVQVLPALAARSDAEARERGVSPSPTGADSPPDDDATQPAGGDTAENDTASASRSKTASVAPAEPR